MAINSVLAPVKRVAAAHELLWNLTLRELRTKYRKSVLGWTWSMLNPLATVAIYTFVFGHLFQAQAPVVVAAEVAAASPGVTSRSAVTLAPSIRQAASSARSSP